MPRAGVPCRRTRGWGLVVAGLALCVVVVLALADGSSVAANSERGSERRAPESSREDPRVKPTLDEWERANGERDFSHRPFDELGYVEPALAEQERRRGERRERRNRPEERERRRRSRWAHKQLGREEKVRLARQEFPETFSTRDAYELPLMAGERVERYLGENVAVIESADGERSLVDSTTALRAPEGGELEPVDFGLEAVADGWEPVNGPVDVEFGERSGDAFALAGAFEAGIPGSSATGDRVANEVFFAEVAKDTDAWFGPAPTGVHFAFSLRSEDAPEELRLRLDAGPDGDLRVLAGGKTVEVLRGGKVVGRMGAPTAFDAEEEPVDVTVRVEGKTVVFEVPHRGRDLLYPAILDPVTEDQSGWKYGANNYGGWRYYEQVPQFPHGYNTGLYIQRNTGYYWYRGQFAEWQYPAPTAGSAIYRTDFMYMAHNSDFTNATQGIWSTRLSRHQHQYTQGYPYNYSGTSTYWSACADGGTEPWQCDESVNFYESNGNYAQTSLWANADGRRYGFSQMYMGGARVYLNDLNDPVALYFQEPPAGWVHTVPAGPYNGPNEVHIRWGDEGLGMKRMWMEAPGMATQYAPEPVCTGAHTSRCPADIWHNFSYASLPEGTRTVTYRAQDVLTRNGRIDRTLRIDRSAPAPPTPSGSLHARAGDFVGPQTYTLGIQGSDSYSGVKSVSYRVVRDATGTQVAAGSASNPTCSTSGCSTSWKPADFNIDASNWAAGRHTVEMTVKDQLGDDPTHGTGSHTTKTSFTVEMDRNPPTVSVSHEGLEPWLDDDREVRSTVTGIDAESGIKTFNLDFPTGPDETRTRSCSGTGANRCPTQDTETFTYRTNTDRFPQEGRHQLRATVTDARGIGTTSPPWSVNIDRTPPALALSGTLYDRRDQELPQGSYDLQVASTDGTQGGPPSDNRSGVRSIEILLDGQPVDRVEQGCADGSCRLDRTWSFDTQDHVGGEHVVEVISQDQLGHEARREFSFSGGPCCITDSPVWGASQLHDDIFVGDVNGDARTDVVGRNALTREYETALSTASGFEAFSSWGRPAAFDTVVDVGLGDVNGDGLEDLVGRDAITGGVLVAASNGSSFEAASLWSQWPTGRTLKLADADGDGRADLAGRDPSGELVVGYSTGTSFEAGQSWTSYTVDPTHDVHFADVDADGAEDVVVRNGDSIQVGLSRDGVFEPLTVWGSLAQSRKTVLGDANGDFKADLIGVDESTGDTTLAVSTGTEFGGARSFGSVPARYDVRAIDGDGDSETDLLSYQPLTGELRVALTRMAFAQGEPSDEWSPKSGLAYDTDDPFSPPFGEPDVPPDNPPADPIALASAKRTTMRLAFQDDRRLLQRYLLPRNMDGSGIIDEQSAFGPDEAAAETAIRRILAPLKAAGGNNDAVKPVIRFNVYQGWHENRPGTVDAAGNPLPYDWSKLDKAVDLARANGFAVYLTISGRTTKSDCNSTYNRAGRGCRPDGQVVPFDQRTGVSPDVDEFGDFAREVVRHFNGRVVTYSIWNEPNNDGFLSAGSDDFVPIYTYRRLYLDAYTKIKALHKGNPATYAPVRVFIGELAYFARSGRMDCANCKKERIDALEFLERTVRTNSSSQQRLVTNGVAWHPYQHVGTPTRRGPRKLEYGIGRAGAIQALITRLADPEERRDERTNKPPLTTPGGKVPPLYFTEFGYHNQPLPDAKPAKGNGYWKSEALRAKWLPLALDRARNVGARWMLIYQTTEIPPAEFFAQSPPGVEPPIRTGADYGLFSPGGDVRGNRSYGRKQGGRVEDLEDPPPAARAAYCSIYSWARRQTYFDRNAAPPANPCQP